MKKDSLGEDPLELTGLDVCLTAVDFNQTLA